MRIKRLNVLQWFQSPLFIPEQSRRQRYATISQHKSEK